MNDIQITTPATGVYRSYLVRFWQGKEEIRWRASAQSVQTGSTVFFGDVAGLLAFLQAEVERSQHADKQEEQPVP